ncbi:hypothetical protein [Streptomyces sp. NPDC007205]|uniref:hypothetical protein n=1 Tax=Streptomyces sp. NPDC007205 TaxID=3154316 RepID=UPI0033DAE80D
MRATAARNASGVSSGMGISGPYGPSVWALTVTYGASGSILVRYRWPRRYDGDAALMPRPWMTYGSRGTGPVEGRGT